MIARKSISEVENVANLTELIGESITLKRQGRNLVGLCPFHNEKTPSFHVRDDNKGYYCFGCGASGGVFSYYMQTRGLSFPETVEELARRYGVTLEYEGRQSQPKESSEERNQILQINQYAASYFQSCFKSSSVAASYMRGRGMSNEAIAEFGVGFATDSWDGLLRFLAAKKIAPEMVVKAGLARKNESGRIYDLFRNRIIFPIYYDRRSIVAFGGRVLPGADDNMPKYINSPETVVWKKGRMFFGLPQAMDQARKSKRLYIVEGYMDVVGLWQAGVQNSVATCGTALTADHVRRLSHLVDHVTLLFDGDTAGRTAASKAFPTFINSGLDASVSFVPEGDDPDTFAAKHQNASAEISKLPNQSLFDAHLNAEIEKARSNDGVLLPAARGKVAAILFGVIREIKNNVERASLLDQLSARLMVSRNEIEGIGVKAKSIQNSASQNIPMATTVQINPKLLPEVDRQLLMAAIAEPNFIDEALKDPLACNMLRAESRGLLLELHGAKATGQGFAALMSNKGSECAAFYKQALDMAAHPNTDLKLQYEGCIGLFKRRSLEDQVRLLDSMIIAETMPEEKMVIIQRKMAVLKTLKTNL